MKIHGKGLHKTSILLKRWQRLQGFMVTQVPDMPVPPAEEADSPSLFWGSTKAKILRDMCTPWLRSKSSFCSGRLL